MPTSNSATVLMLPCQLCGPICLSQRRQKGMKGYLARIFPLALTPTSSFFLKIWFQLNSLKVNHSVWTAANANVFLTRMSRLLEGPQAASSSLPQPSAEYATWEGLEQENPPIFFLDSTRRGLENGQRAYVSPLSLVPTSLQFRGSLMSLSEGARPFLQSPLSGTRLMLGEAASSGPTVHGSSCLWPSGVKSVGLVVRFTQVQILAGPRFTSVTSGKLLYLSGFASPSIQWA